MPTQPETRGSELPWTQDDLGDVLELSALQTLHDLDPRDGLAFLRDYLRMFHGTLEQALAKMQQCQADEDLSGLAFETHKLQSAAAHLGAHHLTAACKALTAAATGDGPDRGEERQALISEVIEQTRRLAATLARLVSA